MVSLGEQLVNNQSFEQTWNELTPSPDPVLKTAQILQLTYKCTLIGIHDMMKWIQKFCVVSTKKFY